MKIKIFFVVPAFVLFVSFLLCAFASAKHYPPAARTIDPIVSTEWLEANMGEGGPVIIDVRSPDAYSAGHIPGSINEPFVVPFSAWITMRDGLLLEVPDQAALFGAIGNLGISGDSRVVIIADPNPGDPAPHYGLSAATRVATTLIYAGIRNVAILDGGYAKWVADSLTITTVVPTVVPVTYQGVVNMKIFVDMEYVKKSLKKADIIDARDADVYFGVTIEPFAAKAGHIPNAGSLPAPWIWDLNTGGYYTFKAPETLGDMASGVIRGPWGHKGYWGYKGPCGQEIIVYCGVGGYASSWWFILTQVLEYKNVKFYDGAAQEWVIDNDMVPYEWN
jgi:thiosulfate/3-mercaptopyruvate sulfurtransferase